MGYYYFQCVAVDAVVETDLVSALQVSVFPEIIFTKAGKILYREKGNVSTPETIQYQNLTLLLFVLKTVLTYFSGIRTADELSKIMAFFYYGASKPPCLNGVVNLQEQIPLVDVSVN